MNQNLKFILVVFIAIFFVSCSSTKKITEKKDFKKAIIETGIASWYGPNFHGKKTANGEIYNMHGLTAAHRTLPFNTIVKVYNNENSKTINVRINDRGPFAKNRIIDLSKRAAEKLGFVEAGTTMVFLSIVEINSELPTNIKLAHYTVQIGSFRSERDANKLSKSISDSFVKKVLLNNKTYFRVYMGLYINIKDAKKKQIKLRQQGIDGFVKQYEN